MIISFPITGHFDIIRSYNSQTGEQSNVLTENMTDRDGSATTCAPPGAAHRFNPSTVFANTYGDDSSLPTRTTRSAS